MLSNGTVWERLIQRTRRGSITLKPLAAPGFNGAEFHGPFGRFAVTVAHAFVSPKLVRCDPILVPDKEYAVEEGEYTCSLKAFSRVKGYNHVYVAKKFFDGGLDVAIITEKELDKTMIDALQSWLPPKEEMDSTNELRRALFLPHADPPFEAILHRAWGEKGVDGVIPLRENEQVFRVADVGYPGLSGCTVLQQPGGQFRGIYAARIPAPRLSLERLKKIASVVLMSSGILKFGEKVLDCGAAIRGLIKFTAEKCFKVSRTDSSSNGKYNSCFSVFRRLPPFHTFTNPTQSTAKSTQQPLDDDLKAIVLAMRNEMRNGFKDMDERFKDMDERFKQVDERFDEMDESIQSQLGSLQQDLTNHVRRVAVVTSAHDIWNELQKSENWLHMKKSDFTANSELCVKVRMSRTAMKSVTWLRTGQLKHSVTVGYDKRGIRVHAFDRTLDLGNEAQRTAAARTEEADR